jgi:hypothetical protein
MSADQATQVIRADALAIERAARALAHGQLVAFPTETVYGLGAVRPRSIGCLQLEATRANPLGSIVRYALCGGLPPCLPARCNKRDRDNEPVAGYGYQG